MKDENCAALGLVVHQLFFVRTVAGDAAGGAILLNTEAAINTAMKTSLMACSPVTMIHCLLKKSRFVDFS